MGKHSFYCFNEYCQAVKRLYLQPNENIGQELEGKKLCQSCYDAGYRLTYGVIVVPNRDKRFIIK